MDMYFIAYYELRKSDKNIQGFKKNPATII